MDGEVDDVASVGGTADPQTPAWHYLSSDGGTSEAVNSFQLAGLLDTALLTLDSLVWTQGQEKWSPLKDIPELYSQVYYISSSGQSQPLQTASSKQQAVEVQEAGSAAVELASAAGVGNTGERPKQAQVRTIQAPSLRPSQPADDALAEFNAEIADLGENVNTEFAPSPSKMAMSPVEVEAGEGPSTPPPEEQEFEDDDGTVYQWDPKFRKYQPKEAGAAGSTGYRMEDMTFEMDEETIPALEMPKEDSEAENEEDNEGNEKDKEKQQQGPKHIDTEKEILEIAEVAGMGGEKGKGKKRSAADVMERIAEKKKKAKEQAEAQKQWFDLKKNTSIYVTGLPDDIDEPQLAERFGQYGVVKPGEDGAPRVKIYRDKNTQMPKGDGLVTFLYEPSVELACKLADDDFFRPDMAKKMTVQPAKFEMHGAEYVPKKKPSKKKTTKDKQKMAAKVLGWGGFDDTLKPSQITVILENLFHPDEIIADPSLLKDLDADIKEESATLGPVDKVKVFAGNPKGIVSVKFKTEEGAQACLNKMNGRFFGGRQVVAKLWDGFTNYNVKLQESEEQIQARREQFAREIEAQEVEEKLKREQNDAPSLQVEANT